MAFKIVYYFCVLCMGVLNLCVRLCTTCISGARGGQKTASDPLGLELGNCEPPFGC